MGTPVDFTQGSIVRGIIRFSLPIVAGELLQNLYNSVDALVVGNLVSKQALAAVTVCGVISNMLVNFFNGMSVGSNVVVSKAFGRSDREERRRAVKVTFTFAVLLGVFLSLAGILFTPQLLKIAGAQAGYYMEAECYLRIYLAGLMFTVIYNTAAGILRALGNSRTPFYILLVSCSTNIVLDLLFVGLFSLGVAGVGLATVCSQILSVMLIYRAIIRQEGIESVDFPALRLYGKSIIPAVLDVGLTAGMQSALIGFSNIFVVRYMNLFSTASVAGIGIAQRLDRFIVLPAKSFGITMTTFIGQNLGAKRYDRLRNGKRRCMQVAIGVTLALSAIVFLFMEECVSLFNSDPEVVQVGVAMMQHLVPMFWIMAAREVLLGILRGNGKSRVPMVLSLIGMVGVRQVFLAVVMRDPAIEYIYICYPLAWGSTLILLTIYYLTVRKKMVDAFG